METEILKMVVTNGVFCVLFVWLLIDTKKDSKQREEKYIDTIDKLADNFTLIKEVKSDVQEIKQDIVEIKKDIRG